MMETSKKYAAYIVVILAVIIVASCTKMDEYTEFLKGKETVYTGKADSVEVHAGRNRLSLSWLVSDPKISRAVIYWNNMADSVEVSITRSGGIDTVSVLIPDLAIGVYNFVIYHFDADNNKSVPVYATGRVYGDNYEKNLVNRRILSAYRWDITAGPLFIVWDKLDQASANVAIGTKVTYTDNDGQLHTQWADFATSSDTTIISMPANVSSSAAIEYRTMIKPDAIALDTFYAPIGAVNYSFTPAPANVRISEDVSGTITTNLANSTINKADLTFTRTITVARKALDKTLPYSVDLELTTSGIPSGAVAANLQDISITKMDGTPLTMPVTTVDVPANESVQIKITMPKSVLDANTGQMVAFNVTLSNLKTSKFSIDGPAFLSSVVVDVEGFKEPSNDVTSTYILNPGAPFLRSDSYGGQYGRLQDWRVNKFILKNNTTLKKEGFNTNGEVGGGYMYASRLSGETKPTEGKIWQNVALPVGKYQYEMDFKEFVFRSEVSNNAFFLSVAATDTLPGTGINVSNFPGKISDGIAYTRIDFNTFSEAASGNTKTVYNKTATMSFQLADPKTVALGFVVSIQNTNPYFLCSAVRLKKYVLKAFD